MRDRLPDKLRTVVEQRMRQAYHACSAVEAEGLLKQLARELDKTHPGAAASLREGLSETLTVLRLACLRPWRARYAPPTRSNQ